MLKSTFLHDTWLYQICDIIDQNLFRDALIDGIIADKSLVCIQRALNENRNKKQKQKNPLKLIGSDPFIKWKELFIDWPIDPVNCSWSMLMALQTLLFGLWKIKLVEILISFQGRNKKHLKTSHYTSQYLNNMNVNIREQFIHLTSHESIAMFYSDFKDDIPMRHVYNWTQLPAGIITPSIFR